MKALIVSGGNINIDFALSFLKKNKYEKLIAADKGLEFFLQAGIVPTDIIGDFDSLQTGVLEKYKMSGQGTIHLLPKEKDTTDTEEALLLAFEAGVEEIALLGATGKRMDHFLANLHLLKRCLDKEISCAIYDSWNRISLHDRGFELMKQQQFGTYVSFLPFAGSVKGLTLRGFQYPLSDYTLNPDNGLGVSNELQAEKAEVLFESGLLLMVQSRD